MQTLADLDYTPVVTVALDDSAATAVERLIDQEATELYVVDDDDRLLGIVPDYELLKARLNGSWTELTVEQVMSRRVLCFTTETTVAEAMKSFREGQHSRAALIADGRLCGQITRTTLLRTCCATDPGSKPIAAPKFLHSTQSIRVLADALCS